ncbi:MAG TPA: hypothetical protein VKE74_29445 [Gemmataceae bacterium]|nr:hypothetical protein [Gemmataceae bacterium]
MSCFADVVAPAVPPDPTKHVNYTYGMVLGVDEFVQEFAYLAGHEQLLVRELLGYGTAFGLRVSYSTEGGEPEVRVSSGLGVVPVGQLVRVPADQCAKLNAWIAAHKNEVRQVASSPLSPPEPLRLAVVLRYHECLTDDVPIPGEPCRSIDELMAPSRVRDDFRLDLRVIDNAGKGLPEQREEDVLRQFAAALKAVPLEEDPSASPYPANLWEQALKDWAPGSPIGPPGVSVPAAHAAEYYRTAFRVWATSLRPKYTRTGADPTEPYLLLAELVVPLTPDLKVPEGANVEIIEDRRPILLHMRLIQELVFPFGGGAGLLSPLGPVPVGPAAGKTVSVETAFGQSPWAGSADEYSRADHTHGTPPDPIPGHVADKMAHELFGDAQGPIGKTVVVALNNTPLNTAVVPAAGQVLTVTLAAGKTEWTPTAFAGDLTGPPDAATVVGLQKVQVAGAAPAAGQFLGAVDKGGKVIWTPVDAPAAPPPNLRDVVRHPFPVVDSGGKAVAARFDIVAAGTLDVTGKGGVILNVVAVPETFNNLEARVDNRLNPRALLIRFDDYQDPGAQPRYVVKLTAKSLVVQGEGHSLPFIPYLIDFAPAGGNFPAGFRVGLQRIGEGLIGRAQLQVEVSDYRLG